MKRIFLTAFLAAAMLIGFSSCDQGLFQTNIFAGFENFASPSADNADDLLGAKDDDRFYEDIAGDGLDDPYVEQVITTLETVVNDPDSTTEEKQDASLMLADVYMAASGADEVFDEFNNTLNDFVNAQANGTEPGVIIEEPQDIIGLLFDTTAPVEDIETQLMGLLLTAGALINYGNTLDGDTGTPDGENAGDIAAQALVAGMVLAIAEETSPGDPEAALPAIAAAIFSGVWTDMIPAFTEGDSFTSILDPSLANVVNQGLDLSAFGL